MGGPCLAKFLGPMDYAERWEALLHVAKSLEAGAMKHPSRKEESTAGSALRWRRPLDMPLGSFHFSAAQEQRSRI